MIFHRMRGLGCLGSLPFIFTGPGRNHPNTIGIITTKISSHPPISAIDPSKLQKLSGAQLPSIVVWDEPIPSVTTSVTKALVMAPAIGAIAPPLNTVPAVAPTAAPVATIPAFFIVPHPTRQALVAMVSHTLRTVR